MNSESIHNVGDKTSGINTNLKSYAGLSNGLDGPPMASNGHITKETTDIAGDILHPPNGNGVRRDSTQAWTPLLHNGHNNKQAGGNSDDNICLGEGHTANGKNINEHDLYTGTGSNNNDELKNLKNEMLHHHHHHHQCNNNGSLVNGKNGLGQTDKYDEHDPLTGLYKQQRDSTDSNNTSTTESPQGCGLFGCRPKWASGLASTHVFMVVFLVAYILQGMYMTYFVSVITTIEKLFQIKSKTTGFLLSASEMGQISTAMLLTYYAGRGHRPRWIACGMVLFSIAAFACALPHFIFGKDLLHSNAILSSNTGMFQENLLGSLNGVDLLNSSVLNQALMRIGTLDMNLCVVGDNLNNSSQECNEDRKMEQASHSKITVIVLCIFFASLLSSGIGQTAVSTLGIPYIDDNVASKHSPMYMAITIGIRILGPASGFIVGSFCTRWYVNFTNPGYDASDPRWIGAWWLGPVVIGSLMLLSSLAMFSFPKELRGKKPPPGSAIEKPTEVPAEPEEKPRLRDFPKTVKRQLSNDILMFRTASCVFHLLPIAGLYTFLPKYLETQFRLAPYDANMIAAFCGILVMGIGIVISGLVIFSLKPTAKAVAAWIALTALVYSAGMVILMFVGCNMSDFAGYQPATNLAPATIEPACSAALQCACDKEQFAPICGLDGKIYISSCHAGCSAAGMRSSDYHRVYSNCTCIPDEFAISDKGFAFEATSGYCDSNCKNFIIFIIIFAICVFMHSTSEVGSMLLVMRCTHPKDKAMAMGVIQSAIGLFGNVPCPIIYGAVVDSACLIWKSVCGKHGACSLYDADTFRHYFLGITAGIMFLAFIMDLVVWSKAHRIDIAPEDKKDNSNKSSETDGKKSTTAASPDTRV